jgi:polysaccharide biosynthesis protein PslJ
MSAGVLNAPARPDAEDELPPISRGLVFAVWAFTVVSTLVVVAAAVVDRQATTSLAAVTAILIVVAGRNQLLAWPTLLGSLIAVIMFIPMRRYTIAGGLPFALEPYRVMVAMIFPCWIAAAMIDGKTKIRATGFEAPAFCYGVVVLLSLVTNPDRVAQLSTEVLKSMTFLASFFAVMYLVASVPQSRSTLDKIIKLIVISGGIVAVLTLVEWQTGTNVFNSLDRVIPVLTFHPELIPWTPGRGGKPRAYASAQHAIALGALLVMLLPLAVYLWRRTGSFKWMGIGGLMVMGALGTGSRTAVIMLVVSLIMFLRYKRRQTLRMLPYLLPMLIVIQGLMPGTLGTFRASLFPSNGSVISQEAQGDGTGTGRLEQVGPSLRQWGQKPLFGQGLGTRMTSRQDVATSGVYNAHTLDDQWLSSLLEVGLFGVLSLVWLIIRAMRKLKFRAKRDESEYGWLLTALSTGICAYAFGMFTYDAFSFIQVTLMFYIFLGLSAAALRLAPEAEEPPPTPAAGEPAAPSAPKLHWASAPALTR